MLHLSFPTGAGAHTPQFVVTDSKAVKGIPRGGHTHTQGGAPGKRSPGRGLNGKGTLKEGGGHGASASCGEGAAPRREPGRPRVRPDGLGGWAKKGDVLTCTVLLQRAGERDPPACSARTSPSPAPAMPPAPAPAAASPRFRLPPEVRRPEKKRGESAAASADTERITAHPGAWRGDRSRRDPGAAKEKIKSPNLGMSVISYGNVYEPAGHVCKNMDKN